MTRIVHEAGNYFGIETTHIREFEQWTIPSTDEIPNSVVTDFDWSTSQGFSQANYLQLRNEGKLIPYTDWRQEFLKGRVSEASYTLRSNAYAFEHRGTDSRSVNPFIDFSSWYSYPRTFSEDGLYADYGIDYEAIGRDKVQEAAARIYSSGWDGLTWAAELHKVADLFRSFIRKWAGIDPRRLHEMWLEGRYGWRLLMYDIQDINHLIQTIHDERSRFKRSTGISGSESRVTQEQQIWVTAGKLTVFLVHKDELQWSIRGSITADIDPPKVSLNPITTSWELMRFSFVIDWIIDIGQWLEAMSFLLLQHSYYAARGLQMTLTRTTTCAGASSTVYDIAETTFVAECEKVYTRRLPCSVSKLPSLGLNLNVYKVVDLLAILAKFLKFR